MSFKVKMGMVDVKNLVEAQLNTLIPLDFAGYKYPCGYWARQNEKLYFEEECQKYIELNKIEVVE